jgi:hypothetical protein
VFHKPGLDWLTKVQMELTGKVITYSVFVYSGENKQTNVIPSCWLVCPVKSFSFSLDQQQTNANDAKDTMSELKAFL